MRHGRRARQAGAGADLQRRCVERLIYNNPYSLELERMWFDGRIVYAVESGEVELEFDDQRNARDNKVAQEYQLVYSVELDERGKLKDDREPERVEGQGAVRGEPSLAAGSAARRRGVRPTFHCCRLGEDGRAS